MNCDEDEKIIAIFKSDCFDTSWPDDGTDPNEPPLGKDLAEYFKTRLHEKGIEVDSPFESEVGWEFFVTIENILYSLLVHWAPIGEPQTDFWVIQPQKQEGCLKGLFGKGRGQKAEDLKPFLKILKPIVNESKEFTDVEWLSYDEFSAIY